MPKAPAKQQPRKRVAPVARAFLFSDLRGYTSFVEAKGDAAAAALLRDYRTLVRKEVARSEGAEVKTEGDSFYVVFGSASVALDCAVAILRRAEARNAKETDAPLRIGVGLHAGETVEYDDQFVGSAVNIASRLASKAGPGELLISETLRGLVRTGHDHAMTDRGPQRLKGVTERIRAWQVAWGGAAASTAPALKPAAPEATTNEPLLAPSVVTRPVRGQLICPIVIGRDAEREQALELLSSAEAGHGRTLLVAGEAGVGKSAFVREVQAAAAERGFRILLGATIESDTGLPYAPFLGAVRSGFRGVPHDRLGRVLAQVAPDLAQLFPELGRTKPRLESSPGSEPHRLAVAFQGLLGTFARETPILLVIEDLHWADEASLSLMQHLSREIRDSRILILGTYRSDELHRRHPFLRVLAALQRERLASEVALRPLSPAQVTELIRATFAVTQPDVTVADAFRDAIYSRSEGNPFFTEELLKTLMSSGDVFFREGTGWGRKDIAELSIPGSVREAVRARVERLSPEAQATLSAAAAIGQRWSFGVLGTVRGLAHQDLLAHVREFIEQQIVVEVGGDDDLYVFRHALTREVVYEELLGPERKQLHRAIALNLGTSEATEPSLLAHHLLAAGDQAAAVPHLLEAAARAHGADAPREAAAHYERALEIGLAPEVAAATTERLAEAYHLFDWTKSRRAAEQALKAYRALGDARGASRMLRLASRCTWLLGDTASAAALADEAIEALAGIGDSVELARATAHLAQLRLTNGQTEAAIELADRAIDVGRRFADPWAESNALITKGTAERRSREGSGVLDTLLRGRDLAIASDMPQTALRAYYNGFYSVLDQGWDFDRCRAYLEEALGYARAHGVQAPGLATQLGIQLAHHGDWDAALGVAAQGVYEANRLYAEAFVALGREGPEAWAQLARRIVDVLAPMEEPQWSVKRMIVAADVEALLGRTDEARSLSSRLRDLMRTDPRIRAQFVGFDGWTSLLLFLAAAIDEPEWVGVVEELNADNAEVASSRAMWLLARSARGIFEGSDRAGPDLQTLYDELASAGLEAFGAYSVVRLGREAVRHHVPVARAAADAIRRARALAARLDARWWTAQLDAIEAAEELRS